MVGPKLNTGRGEHFIILYVGKDGFVFHGLLKFRSRNGNKGGYYDSTNHLRFRRWFEEQLLSNIPHNLLIIKDTASYHSKITNKHPDINSNKAEIRFAYNRVEYDAGETKSKLPQTVALNKERKIRNK